LRESSEAFSKCSNTEDLIIEDKMTEEEMLPGLPAEVLKEDREKLISFQKQIKILVNNHQILVCRSERNPKDEQVIKQIEDVKNYLISFSDQQRVVLDKVRSYLKSLEEEKRRNPQSTELGPPLTVPPKQDLKSPRSTTPVKTGKQNPKSKKGKRKSVKNSRSTSPDSTGDEECDPVLLAYFESETCFRGHVEDYDVHCPPEEDLEEDTNYSSDEEVNFPRVQNTLDNSTREDYMLNIDLLTEVQHKMIVKSQEDKRKKKGRKRVSTFVPEVADKKYRYQTFLQSSITSPPHLRRRKPSQLPAVPPKVAKALSFPTFTPPLGRMETRKKSPSMAKSQLDGANDEDFEDMLDGHHAQVEDIEDWHDKAESIKGMHDEAENMEDLHDDNHAQVANLEDLHDVNQAVTERLKVRDDLLDQRRKMKEEMVLLQTRKEALADYREVQKEEKWMLLKEREELEHKIEFFLNILKSDY